LRWLLFDHSDVNFCVCVHVCLCVCAHVRVSKRVLMCARECTCMCIVSCPPHPPQLCLSFTCSQHCLIRAPRLVSAAASRASLTCNTTVLVKTRYSLFFVFRKFHDWRLHPRAFSELQCPTLVYALSYTKDVCIHVKTLCNMGLCTLVYAT